MTTASRFLEAARSELGYTESPAGSNRTKFAKQAGHANAAPWCATFLVAIARRVEISLPSESAYTPTMANGFKAAKAWHTQPRPGDVAFFDFPDSKRRIQHVGVVETSTSTTVTCIEANTSAGRSGSQDNGGGVYRRTRPRSHVVGFGRPAYTPSRRPEPPAPPVPAPTSSGPSYPDDSMTPHFISLHAKGAHFDGQGNGYWDLAQFPWERTVVITPNVADPATAGTYNVPDVAFVKRGEGIRVIVEEGVAGHGLDVRIWTVGA